MTRVCCAPTPPCVRSNHFDGPPRSHPSTSQRRMPRAWGSSSVYKHAKERTGSFHNDVSSCEDLNTESRELVDWRRLSVANIKIFRKLGASEPERPTGSLCLDGS